MDRDCIKFCRERKIKDLGWITSCQDVQKQIFKEEKNTEMNKIKYATQPKIQTIF